MLYQVGQSVDLTWLNSKEGSAPTPKSFAEAVSHHIEAETESYEVGAEFVWKNGRMARLIPITQG